MADIKPTGNFGKINYPSADSPGDAKPNKTFSVVQGAPETGTGSVSSSILGNQFCKADLKDPAKLDSMVRSSASELVKSQSSAVSMSSSDKQVLTDFLSEDPLFRQRIENYLRKALP
jgi:hypothetical protein